MDIIHCHTRQQEIQDTVGIELHFLRHNWDPCGGHAWTPGSMTKHADMRLPRDFLSHPAFCSKSRIYLMYSLTEVS